MKRILLIVYGLVIAIFLCCFDSCKHYNKYPETIDALNTSFEISYTDTKKEIEDELADFENKELKSRSEIAKPYYDHAIKIIKTADEVCQFVDSLKKQLIQAGHGSDSEVSLKQEFKSESSISYTLLVKTGKAANLKRQIDNAFESMVESEFKGNYETIKRYYSEVRYKDNFGKDSFWVEKKFGNDISLALAIVNLSKIESDITIMALGLIKEFHRQSKGICGLQFDPTGAVVIPKAQSVVLVGDRYEAAILVYSKFNDHYGIAMGLDSAEVNGKPLRVINGVGVYSVNATTSGKKEFHGTATIKNWDSSVITREFRGEYLVTPKVSPFLDFENSHFIYAGTDNPVTVTFPLTDLNRLNLRMSRGKVTGGNGKFNIRVNDPGPVTIYVEDKLSKGRHKVIDSFIYMVKTKE